MRRDIGHFAAVSDESTRLSFSLCDCGWKMDKPKRWRTSLSRRKYRNHFLALSRNILHDSLEKGKIINGTWNASLLESLNDCPILQQHTSSFLCQWNREIDAVRFPTFSPIWMPLIQNWTSPIIRDELTNQSRIGQTIFMWEKARLENKIGLLQNIW